MRDAMAAGMLGMIASPGGRQPVIDEVPWCADNSVFGGNYPGDDEYLAWLEARRGDAHRCAFATAPDVVGDATETLARSLPILPKIRALGYPAALVAQDGLEHLPIPWDAFDVLFIGGSTEWKLGPHARAIIREARYRGKWIHMGRVNSEKRLRYAHALGCHSADGTFLAFGPDKNLPQLLAWLRRIDEEHGLFDVA